MSRPLGTLLTASAAALTLACSSNTPPAAPAPEPVQAAAAPEPAVGGALSDERVMELGRGYVELLHARDYAKLWERVTPESKQRFTTLEAFQAAGEEALKDLGKEVAVVSERVELPRAGMAADKLYFRLSKYSGVGATNVRLLIGLKNDGSIVGIQLRRVE